MSTPKHFRNMLSATFVALALSASGLFAAEQRTHEHTATPAKLTLNDGKKWGTDEALRKGMENIRNAMDASLHRIHEGKQSNTEYAALAGKLNGELGGIVANCKLEAKADAQLHLVIADIAEGIEAMEGKAKTIKRQAGALKILGALEKYGSHFDHPGWQAITH